MTIFDSINELRDIISSLEERISKLEALLKQKQEPSINDQSPTEKQLKFAKDISAVLGHDLEFEKMTKQEVSDYITKNKSQYYQQVKEKQEKR